MAVENMIKRVARAIVSASENDPDGHVHLGRRMWQLYIPEARAAIEAMREPTPEMVKAGLRCGDTGPEPALGVWRDMIDTALEENDQ